MDNVKRFFEKVQADAGIQGKLKAMQEKTQEEAIAATIALAKENGFEISQEDLLAYARGVQEAIGKNRELDEAELEAVAGGSYQNWLIGSLMILFCVVSLSDGSECKLNTNEVYRPKGNN